MKNLENNRMKRFNTVNNVINNPLKDQMSNFSKSDFIINTISATVIEEQETDFQEIFRIRITDHFPKDLTDHFGAASLYNTVLHF